MKIKTKVHGGTVLQTRTPIGDEPLPPGRGCG